MVPARAGKGGRRPLGSLTLGAVEASEALLAVALARVAEAVAAAVAGAAALAAVLGREVVVALAHAAHAHAVPAAVFGAGGVGAVGAHVRRLALAAAGGAAPVATARSGTGGPLARGALPALLAATGARLRREGPVAAAVVAAACGQEESGLGVRAGERASPSLETSASWLAGPGPAWHVLWRRARPRTKTGVCPFQPGSDADLRQL